MVYHRINRLYFHQISQVTNLLVYRLRHLLSSHLNYQPDNLQIYQQYAQRRNLSINHPSIQLVNRHFNHQGNLIENQLRNQLFGQQFSRGRFLLNNLLNRPVRVQAVSLRSSHYLGRLFSHLNPLPCNLQLNLLCNPSICQRCSQSISHPKVRRTNQSFNHHCVLLSNLHFNRRIIRIVFHPYNHQ